MDEKRVKLLSTQLGHKNLRVRLYAVSELGVIKGVPAVFALINAIHDVDQQVQSCAIAELKRMGQGSILPAFIQALKDGSLNQCYWTSKILGEIGDPSAVPALIGALKDENIHVIYWTTNPLGRILRNCNSIEEVQEFEDGLDEGLANLRKNGQDEKNLKKAEFKIAKLRIKIAEKKNEFTGKRDILLPDKPKPPKKGRIYCQAKRVLHG